MLSALRLGRPDVGQLKWLRQQEAITQSEQRRLTIMGPASLKVYR